MVNKNSTKTGSLPPGFVFPPFPPPTQQAQGGGVQMVQGMVQGQVEPAGDAQTQIYNNRARAFLAAQRFPSGLHEAFFLTCQRAPLHYFICDNSGSMAIDDCNRLIGGINPRNAQMMKCSRWTELCEMMRFHGQLAEAAHTPVEFRFLNDFAPIRVGDGGPGFNVLEQALRSRPTGGTPLCRHIAEITAQVRANEQWLRANNQLACIVIATDGEASDGDIVTALRPLAALPAWVIVRLCTEDEAIDRYWQGVDATLTEVKIDIIEDFLIEAREVHRNNPWLTYGEPLHRMREWGLTFKEMDLAQQRRLGMEEMKVVCELLLSDPNQAGLARFPDPFADFNLFLSAIRDANRREPDTWNPFLKVPRHWIFTADLVYHYSPSRIDNAGGAIRAGCSELCAECSRCSIM